MYKTGKYGPAMGCFDNAMGMLDFPLVRALAAPDRFRLDIAMGKALYSQAREADSASSFHRLLKMGHRFLSSAVMYDPLDFRIVNPVTSLSRQ